jgi:hypothetical protein
MGKGAMNSAERSDWADFAENAEFDDMHSVTSIGPQCSDGLVFKKA